MVHSIVKFTLYSCCKNYHVLWLSTSTGVCCLHLTLVHYLWMMREVFIMCTTVLLCWYLFESRFMSEPPVSLYSPFINNGRSNMTTEYSFARWWTITLHWESMMACSCSHNWFESAVWWCASISATEPTPRQSCCNCCYWCTNANLIFPLGVCS